MDDNVAAVRAGTHILILGGEPTTSAPSGTLLRALRRAGMNVRFSNSAESDGFLSWRRSLQDVRAIVLIAYGRIEGYLLGQLAYAVAAGIPITRWWVGTDVLNVTTDTATADSTRSLDRIVCANIAVSPHLVGELAAAGIRARFIPSVIDSDVASLDVQQPSPTPKPILIYMPTSRQEFYGRNTIESALVSNGALRFVVVGDESHSLGHYGNVESLGWVPDMRPIYDRCGCILRLTQHDGMPRMLIEGLLRGMYAIYSWPLTGCWLATNLEEVQSSLATYATITEPNYDGRAAILGMADMRPEYQIAEIATTSAPVSSVRIAALRISAAQKVRAKLNEMRALH
jgi:hypothetical protein